MNVPTNSATALAYNWLRDMASRAAASSAAWKIGSGMEMAVFMH